jgi:hypothetical protein
MKLKFNPTQSQYDLLKSIDLSELKEKLSFFDDDNIVLIPDVLELQLLLNEEIVTKGMDDEDTVNSYGMQLYDLYDEILDQKEA